jgi:hypothetical protein
MYTTEANDGFTAVATGPDGAVYAAGYARASIPGAGSALLLVKYVDHGATMSEAWHVLTGSEPVCAKRVAVDSSGNVIVAGTQGPIELSGKGSDIVVLKVTAAGKVLWRRTYDGPSHLTDYVNDLALDAHDNALVVGVSTGRGTGRDYITLKLRADGTRAWTRTFAGPERFDEARGVAVDSKGNVYVTGWSDDKDRARRAMTISYSPAGAQRWTARDRTRGSWSGAADVMLSASAGAPGVVITGYQGSRAGHEVLMFTKYSASAGTEVWKRLLRNGAQATEPHAGAIDRSGAPVAVGMTNLSPQGGAFIAGVAAAGGKEWSRVLSSEFTNPGDAEFDAVAMSAGGAVLAGGWTQAAEPAKQLWDYIPTAFAVRYSPTWPITEPLDYIGAGSATSRSRCTAVAIGAAGMYAAGERTTAHGDLDAVLVKF